MCAESGASDCRQALDNRNARNDARYLDIGYDYDAYGNVVRQTHYAVAPRSTGQIHAGPIVEVFSYDLLHRLAHTSRSGDPSQGGQAQQTTLAYDAIGNLTRKTDFSADQAGAYAYAHGSKPYALTAVALPTGGAVAYGYDPNGNVASRVVPAGQYRTAYAEGLGMPGRGRMLETSLRRWSHADGRSRMEADVRPKSTCLVSAGGGKDHHSLTLLRRKDLGLFASIPSTPTPTALHRVRARRPMQPASECKLQATIFCLFQSRSEKGLVMTSRQIPIFATQADWRGVLARIERQRPLQYALMGLFTVRAPLVIRSLFSEVVADMPTSVSVGYLVCDLGVRVELRTVPQRRGGEMYAVDQLENEMSIVLRPGIELKDCLVAGQLGTASSHPVSLELFRLLESEIKRDFARIQSYLVGPSAKALMLGGMRLTANPRSPAEFDLRQ